MECFLLVVEEMVRTKFFEEPEMFDYMNVKSLVVGAAPGGEGLRKGLENVERERKLRRVRESVDKGVGDMAVMV
jgi:hypothetical protein